MSKSLKIENIEVSGFLLTEQNRDDFLLAVKCSAAVTYYQFKDPSTEQSKASKKAEPI